MPAVTRTLTGVAFAVGLADAARVSEDFGSEEGALNLDDFLPLCDGGIVAGTCATYFGQADGAGLVGAEDVKEVLDATRESMVELWGELRLDATQKVSCADLCGLLVEAIPRGGQRQCPPRSDVGCYFDEAGEQCDVDVRPNVLIEETRDDGDLPNFNDESALRTKIDDPEEIKFRQRGNPGEIDYPVVAAVRRTANLFRIYPSALVSVDYGADEEDFEEEAQDLEGEPLTEVGLVQLHNTSAGRHEVAPCKVWLDTDMDHQDKPGFALLARCQGQAVRSARLEVQGREGRGFVELAQGTKYSLLEGDLASNRGRSLKLSYETASQRFSHALQLPNSPSEAKYRNGKKKSGKASSANWKKKIQKVNAKAIGYVSTALKAFHARDTEDEIELWYGPGAYTNTELRKKLKKILNSVNDMLGNVEYVMGPECERGTYAYVYPTAYKNCRDDQVRSKDCTKNDRGQFIFYICPLTLDSRLSEQIETLTHEGSHHASAYTDDVTFDGDTAYGRSTCKKLAKKSWKRAIKNADNFCYYVQDITDGI